MTGYSCLIQDGAFVTAKTVADVTGDSPRRPWSDHEQTAPQYQIVSILMAQADEDYQVEVIPGLYVWASEVDQSLINIEEPV